jgi:hypothetical protein
VAGYYSGIRLEGLRKTTKTSIRIAGRRGRDFNPGPSKYEAGVATTTFGEIFRVVAVFIYVKSLYFGTSQIDTVTEMCLNKLLI